MNKNKWWQTVINKEILIKVCSFLLHHQFYIHNLMNMNYGLHQLQTMLILRVDQFYATLQINDITSYIYLKFYHSLEFQKFLVQQ